MGSQRRNGHVIHRLGAGDYATTLLPPSDALSLFHPRRATSRPKVWLHHCQGASGPTCPGAKGANAADADGGSGGGVYRNDGTVTVTTSPISANTPNNCTGSDPAVPSCTG